MQPGYGYLIKFPARLLDQKEKMIIEWQIL